MKLVCLAALLLAAPASRAASPDELEPAPAGVPDSLKDLPLVEVPAAGNPRDLFAVILTGDGGWAAIDRGLAKTIAEDGIPVVGWSSLRYFWKEKKPERAARDLARVLRHYSSAWGKSGVILIGYSRGAEVIPLMAADLPPDLGASVKAMALLSPADQAVLHVHIGGMTSATDASYPVRPALERARAGKVLCFFGDEEKDPFCAALPPALVESIRLKGKHHYDGDYAAIARRILEENR